MGLPKPSQRRTRSLLAPPVRGRSPAASCLCPPRKLADSCPCTLLSFEQDFLRSLTDHDNRYREYFSIRYKKPALRRSVAQLTTRARGDCLYSPSGREGVFPETGLPLLRSSRKPQGIKGASGFVSSAPSPDLRA